MGKEKEFNRPNSFYKYGNEDVLSIEQDETSFLWKIKFITEEHYVVSREFNRTVGMYGNAPDDVVIVGLMEFSESLIGAEMSIYEVMDKFIDRCFDDGVFDKYTTNALWFSLDYLHYEEMEEILNTYSNRIVWVSGYDYNNLRDVMLKYSPKNGDSNRQHFDVFNDIVERNNIEAVYLNPDKSIEHFIKSNSKSDVPCFIADYRQNGDFNGFSYMKKS